MQRELNYHCTAKLLFLKLLKTYCGIGKLLMAFRDHYTFGYETSNYIFFCYSREILSTFRSQFGLFVQKYVLVRSTIPDRKRGIKEKKQAKFDRTIELTSAIVYF